MPDPIVISRKWVLDFVIRLQLCPFAASPFQQNKIRFVCSKATDASEIIAELLMEIDLLEQPNGPQTSLLIIPHLLHEFDDYLDLFHFAEDFLAERGWADSYQLASFHPDYVFADSPQDDPANATNRSPHPMFHILRCDDVEKARMNYPDILSIPQRNIALLRSLDKLKD